MAKGELKYTKSQIKDLSKKLNDEVSHFKKALSKLEKDVDKLQKGDGNEPYWNGKSACDWTMNCLAHIDHDKVLLEHLEKCSDYLTASVNGGSSL